LGFKHGIITLKPVGETGPIAVLLQHNAKCPAFAFLMRNPSMFFSSLTCAFSQFYQHDYTQGLDRTVYLNILSSIHPDPLFNGHGHQCQSVWTASGDSTFQIQMDVCLSTSATYRFDFFVLVLSLYMKPVTMVLN
jgi:hypothetical protein